MIALTLIAAALCVALLVSAPYKPAGGGEAVMAQAFKTLYLAFALWVVLVAMLVLGGVAGSMPRWTAWLAILLVPMAAVADVVAADMCSRRMEWAIVLVAALPALVGSYAVWARLQPKPAAPAGRSDEHLSALVWGAIFFLSAVTFVIAAY
jgi:hypothetical protein